MNNGSFLLGRLWNLEHMVEGKRRKKVPLVLFNGTEKTPCWDKSRKRTRSAGTQKMQEDSAVNPTEWYGGGGQNKRSKSSTLKDSSQRLFLLVISTVWVFSSQFHLFFQTASLSLVLQSPTLTCHLGIGAGQPLENQHGAWELDSGHPPGCQLWPFTSL